MRRRTDFHRRINMRLPRAILALVLAVSLTFSASAPALAAGLIRDAEIEDLIRDYSRPIFKAAGLQSQGVQIFILKDDTFNAFVADGRRMFINTGTLMLAKTPNAVIGVIAHEAGHIEGSHLSRLRDNLAKSQTAAIIAMLAGIGAMAAGALAGGSDDLGQAGIGIALGGQRMVQRSMLSYRRIEEQSADRAAFRYLEATRQSAKGMLDTFEYFADQQLVQTQYIDPYLLSHPLGRERIAILRDMAENSPYYYKEDPPELQTRHDMMRAKLTGFLASPEAALRKYPPSDTSLPARYARAIAYFYGRGLKPSLREVDGLIAVQPGNPYFHELKGQFLFESGKPRAAIKSLNRAIRLKPDAALIRILLARALLATKNKKDVDRAIAHLRRALVPEADTPEGYRELASAWERKGRTTRAQLASAQYYFYGGQHTLARQLAKRARAKFKKGSPQWIKADDIAKFKSKPKK